MLEAARTVPDAAIMFHMAVEAHRVASRHYQQVFVPTNTSIPRKKGEADSEDSDSDSESDDEDDEDEDEEAAGRGSDIPPIPVYLDGTPTESVYAHDASAAHAAFRLLILALDLLRLCLDSPVLSAKECAAAGLEFATIGSKIFAADEALRRMGRTIPGVAGMSIDMERVAADMGVMLAKSVSYLVVSV
jgi:hypothetical protein